ncbi:MAG: ATP-binding protein [Nitrospinota bacterium]
MKVTSKGLASTQNPFRPGAGHMPLYLAGRKTETEEFTKLLQQETILQNAILTGLRGVGKTVLLETFKPLALEQGWLWVGTDLSESTSVSEQIFAVRLIADLSVATSQIIVGKTKKGGAAYARSEVGFGKTDNLGHQTLDFEFLCETFAATPGLISDKLKAVLELAWVHLSRTEWKGIIFAYDEAQNLSDHADRHEYPLSLLLDTFQSIQRKRIPFMLALTGLPTLFPKLVDARTYAERMFHMITLEQLNKADSREAIVRPISLIKCPFNFAEDSIDMIIEDSSGYPYFIQFICREVFDLWIQQAKMGKKASVPREEIIRKLDLDFFAGRYSRTTSRQRELLYIIANLKNGGKEFAIHDIVSASNEGSAKPFGTSQVNQMLNSLIERGLIYKNRYGRYSFAVPLMGQYILRQGPPKD